MNYSLLVEPPKINSLVVVVFVVVEKQRWKKCCNE